MTRLLLVTFALLLAVFSVAAQDVEAPKTPTLTAEQRLNIENGLLSMELAQLKAQAAQRDFDAARLKLSNYVTPLQVKGWTLTLQPCCAYEKVPEPVEAKKP